MRVSLGEKGADAGGKKGGGGGSGWCCFIEMGVLKGGVDGKMESGEQDL